MSGLGVDDTPRRAIGSHHSACAKSHTWLTPPEILRALGPFDLDPCAAPEPRPWPTAKVHWSWREGGLSRPWFGRVWCNPPFAKAAARQFMGRMAEHGCGTALLFARTETELFFDVVWNRATAILFLRGRPHFHYPDGRRAAANCGAPVVLIAYGAEDAARLRGSGLAGRFVMLAEAS